MLDWRIYYADGSTVDSSQSTWDDAPQDGVVAIVVRDDEFGRVVLNGRDYYYSIPGEPNDIYCAQERLLSRNQDP